MPQPCPASSPDHAKVMVRGPLGAVQAAGRRRAPGLEIGQVLEQDAVVNVLPGGQAGEVHPRGEVGLGERGRADDAPGVPERVRRGVLHDESRGAIGLAPDDGPIRGHVSALHATGDAGAQPVRGHHRGGPALGPDREPRGGSEGGGSHGQQRALEQATPADADAGVGAIRGRSLDVSHRDASSWATSRGPRRPAGLRRSSRRDPGTRRLRPDDRPVTCARRAATRSGGAGGSRVGPAA